MAPKLTYQALSHDDIARLAALLRRPRPNEIKDLPSHLRTRFPCLSPGCREHKRLNLAPLRSLARAFQHEIRVSVPVIWTPLAQAGALEATHIHLLATLSGVPELDRVPCAACWLAHVGANPEVVVALGAVLVGRVSVGIWAKSRRLLWLEEVIGARGQVERMWEVGLGLRRARKEGVGREWVGGFVRRAREMEGVRGGGGGSLVVEPPASERSSAGVGDVEAWLSGVPRDDGSEARANLSRSLVRRKPVAQGRTGRQQVESKESLGAAAATPPLSTAAVPLPSPTAQRQSEPELDPCSSPSVIAEWRQFWQTASVLLRPRPRPPAQPQTPNSSTSSVALPKVQLQQPQQSSPTSPSPRVDSSPLLQQQHDPKQANPASIASWEIFEAANNTRTSTGTQIIDLYRHSHFPEHTPFDVRSSTDSRKRSPVRVLSPADSGVASVRGARGSCRDEPGRQHGAVNSPEEQQSLLQRRAKAKGLGIDFSGVTPLDRSKLVGLKEYREEIRADGSGWIVG